MKIYARFLFTGIPSNQGKAVFDAEEGTTLGTLLAGVKEVNAHPFDHALLAGAMLLVNNRVAGPETVLCDGDEVMIIRTLGGG